MITLPWMHACIAAFSSVRLRTRLVIFPHMVLQEHSGFFIRAGDSGKLSSFESGVSGCVFIPSGLIGALFCHWTLFSPPLDWWERETHSRHGKASNGVILGGSQMANGKWFTFCGENN
jgi:hypothetical protein